MTRIGLFLPLVMADVNGVRYFDSQAQAGLFQWLRNFDEVELCVMIDRTATPPPQTSPFDLDAFAGKLKLHLAPVAYRPDQFLRELSGMRQRLRSIIDDCTHLHFAIGGLWGDWAAVGLLEASARGRKTSVWTDRVESNVAMFQAKGERLPKRWYRQATALAMRHYERHVIRRATIGLFHGADCYAAYKAFSPSPWLVHDIHLSDDDRIDAATLAAKCARRQPIDIVYAGRLHRDKGVMDWIAACDLLARGGTSFTATWYGDGPLLSEARAAIAAHGLADRVAFPGQTDNRDALMAAIRAADIFLFCHKTPESPRCLVEALLSGTPIVGYDSAYPRDLIAVHSGGVLTAGDPTALADAVARLAADGDALSDLYVRAAADGRPMTETAVFEHRAELIKQYS